ncbi:MAG: arsenic resistance N-acetyltransferase ArsN2 [Saprospiraceae bacterium]
MSILLKNASQAQAPDLIDFLQKFNLPTSDLSADISGFTLALDNEQIVGSAGIEVKGDYGLLRSVAVADTHRNQNLGHRLFAAALDYARLHDVQEVYLITNTAERYFEKNGFRRVERRDAPDEITQTEQFSALCPSSAVVMKIDLGTFTKPSRFSKRR